MGNNNFSGYFILLLVVFIICAMASVSCGRVIKQQNHLQDLPESLSRKSFPEGFVFGTASSAYQYEGASNEGGRRPSIWDTFVKTFPAKIKDRSGGSVAVDSYHRYKEDVALMKNVGFDAYRFSISWPRLLPRGKLSGGVNQEGIAYYNDLINELVANGMKPVVTLFHWDLPQALEDEYNGFLSPLILNDFQDFAELCYKSFGDRVKNWITINEPQTFANGGYGTGQQAPGRCSKWVSPKCNKGDSGTEPYVVIHHLLLAHAAAFRVYKERYQSSQKGQIGITLSSSWFLPLSDSVVDSAATSRALTFSYDLFLEPLKSGSYPSEMVKYIGERLPQFTKEQALMLKGSYDFLGINYYTSYYVYDVPCSKENLSQSTDSCAQMTGERNGIPIGPQGGSNWLYVYPEGIFNLLSYTKTKMNNPVIYITENGIDEVNDGTLSLEDNMRIDYHKDHLSYVQKAITHGVDVRGYFAWSFLDNFEWADGYTVRFGIVSIDYKNQLRRYPKKSATWFKEFLHSNGNSQLQLGINTQ